MCNLNFKVLVRCSTFNHSKYIEDAMNGFCMQQTDFPFVCIIIDDASTDGEQKVIEKYLWNNFDLKSKDVREDEANDYKMIFARHKTNINCYFAVYYLKYNHYSIRKSVLPYLRVWTDNAKYRALCEGDDYWIEPLKLQRQFDYIDNHPNCTMVCNRAKLYSEREKKYVGEQYCRNSDGVLNPVDVINRTGLYIPTCSIILRSEIIKEYPEYCQNCNVGDYPLQITAAMKGYIYYIDSVMSVYRIDSPGSWSSRTHFNSLDPKRLQIVRGQTEMLKGFLKDFPQYGDVFQEKIAEHICKNMLRWNMPKSDKKKYIGFFSSDMSNFNLKWRIVSYLFYLGIPKKIFYIFYFNKKYKPMKIVY